MTISAPLNNIAALAKYQNIDTGAHAQGAGADFGNMLQQAVGGAISTNQHAEQQAMSAISGDGDLTQVVTAVSRAELALQTTVAVRDRVLQAYQDIIKMPI